MHTVCPGTQGTYFTEVVIDALGSCRQHWKNWNSHHAVRNSDPLHTLGTVLGFHMQRMTSTMLTKTLIAFQMALIGGSIVVLRSFGLWLMTGYKPKDLWSPADSNHDQDTSYKFHPVTGLRHIIWANERSHVEAQSWYLDTPKFDWAPRNDEILDYGISSRTDPSFGFGKSSLSCIACRWILHSSNLLKSRHLCLLRPYERCPEVIWLIPTCWKWDMAACISWPRQR